MVSGQHHRRPTFKVSSSEIFLVGRKQEMCAFLNPHDRKSVVLRSETMIFGGSHYTPVYLSIFLSRVP